jgi:membrane protein DedA with SNARE-associated domain
VTHLLVQYGLVLLFLFVAIESAGVPVPGETALVTAAVLATPQHHHYSIVWVIVVAAAGAIVGDNVGYWLGRTGGRALLERWEPVARYSRRALPPAERFFRRHGPKTVFLGRFVAVLRVTAAWLAGISRMHWWKFFLWNGTGGIVWATLVGVLAYEFGKAAGEAINRYGLYGLGVVVVLVALGLIGVHIWRARMLEDSG